MNLIVAIRYGKGVIQCTQYEHMNGEFFASFVENNLDAMFMQAGKGISWLWIQHGNPVKIVPLSEVFWLARVRSYYKYHPEAQMLIQ